MRNILKASTLLVLAGVVSASQLTDNQIHTDSYLSQLFKLD